MNLFIEFIGWTLIHFLWQGAAVAALLWCALQGMRCASPQSRYLAAAVAMIALPVCALFTGLWQWPQASPEPSPLPANQATALAAPLEPSRLPWIEPVNSLESPAQPSPGEAAPNRSTHPPSASSALWKLEERIHPWLPWFVLLWSVGVALLSLRTLRSWMALRRLKSTAGSPEAEPAQLFDRLRRLTETRQPVALLTTSAPIVPMVAGWLKPVVIVPASLFIRLPAWQVEAILAHELAHVRRRDYLVNLLQIFIETLLFYHPAVWWISAQIRKEREHCCDDDAASLSRGALDYAKALTALEEWRGSAVPLGAMSAATGSLQARVRRILGLPEEYGAGWPLPLLALAGLLLLLPFAVNAGGQEPFAAPESEHIGDGNVSSFCVHDGKQLHWMVLSDIPFDSFDAGASNLPARTWRDVGTLTFDGEAVIRFLRTSAQPDLLTFDLGGNNAEYNLAQGRIFLRNVRGLRQLDLELPPVTAVEALSKSWVQALVKGSRFKPSAEGDYGGAPEAVLREIQKIRAESGPAADPEAAALQFGPVVNGLQAAIRVSPDKERYDYGEAVERTVVLRNAGDQDISLYLPCACWATHWRGMDELGRRLDSRAKFPDPLDPAYVRFKLAPGQTKELPAGLLLLSRDGKPLLDDGHVHVVNLAVAPNETCTLTWSVTLPEIHPDQKKRVAQPGDWAGELTSNSLSLSVGPAKDADP